MKPGPRSLSSESGRRTRTRTRGRRTGLGAVAVMASLGAAFVTVILVACAAQPSLSGAGQECFAATDCQAGLVCVSLRGGARLCTDDLSEVTGRPPPEAGAAAETGGDGPREANPTDGPVQQDTSMPDTSMPDTSMPPVDAGADG